MYFKSTIFSNIQRYVAHIHIVHFNMNGLEILQLQVKMSVNRSFSDNDFNLFYFLSSRLLLDYASRTEYECHGYADHLAINGSTLYFTNYIAPSCSSKWMFLGYSMQAWYQLVRNTHREIHINTRYIRNLRHQVFINIFERYVGLILNILMCVCMRLVC